MDMESVASDGDELTLRMALRAACSTDATLECRARGVGDAKPANDDGGDDTALHQQPAIDALERLTKQHGHSFSPLWLRSWRVIFDASADRYSQKRHPNGFSPLWLRSWRVIFDGSADRY
jgi:hypothetical protein